jgi:hypothetical protein
MKQAVRESLERVLTVSEDERPRILESLPPTFERKFSICFVLIDSLKAA